MASSSATEATAMSVPKASPTSEGRVPPCSAKVAGGGRLGMHVVLRPRRGQSLARLRMAPRPGPQLWAAASVAAAFGSAQRQTVPRAHRRSPAAASARCVTGCATLAAARALGAQRS
eukprot:CAMPEP_0202740726 /NCGR_PEP_ID=MMETSP1388-20130828/3782_1 /ASSEMBLY_ACC=CAM_ASM_000864 /TAXON_ID=37098 /ORGANISM="Isochrysis sp, Strain CCMP1244" /LENGTH=116 /DNA_ID=CAMNT_0049407501 /DNA_START=138 /DNA_END=489 /DNA_ORIENTATION=-